jgi:serine/threonine protein kinase/DNA-binding XRE family transcriptional regulator
MAGELSFGRLVRARRRALDLTQEELARRVACAPITLRKIEYGTLRPSRQIAERLAVALGIPPEERAAFIADARAVRVEGSADRAPSSPSPAQLAGPDTPADLVGQVRGYQLGPRIGAGGFGAVYRARQLALGRDVAIKVILPQYADHPEFIRRFEAEAQLVARLEHPHIVPLYDYWREPGAAYLVMRYVRGGALQDLLQQASLPRDHVLRLFEQVGDALGYAHRAEIIHRDLKPANILVDAEGNAYLTDFGIAKDLGGEASLTADAAFVGSPGYAAPEQIRGEPITAQSDIYALGVLLYELLAGRRPFPLARRSRDPQRRLRRHRPSVGRPDGRPAAQLRDPG